MAATARLAPHRNRWLRILGVSFVMYVLSYIDRTNIAMATPGDARRARHRRRGDRLRHRHVLLGLHRPADPGRPAGLGVERQVGDLLPAAGVERGVVLDRLRAHREPADRQPLPARPVRGRRADLHDRADPQMVHQVRARAGQHHVPDQHPDRAGDRQPDLGPRAGALQLADDVHRRGPARHPVGGRLGVGDHRGAARRQVARSRGEGADHGGPCGREQRGRARRGPLDQDAVASRGASCSRSTTSPP